MAAFKEIPPFAEQLPPFRSKTGLTGQALWREGKALRSDVANTRLREGDALLCFRARENTRGFEAGSVIVVLVPWRWPLQES